METTDPPTESPPPVTAAEATRYHGLDALRAIMMMLGVLIHTAISYSTLPFDAAWPYKDQSVNVVCDLVVLWIHTFRMPLFFVLAGFFAALLRDRRGVEGMLRNRMKRIAGPFVVGLVVLTPLVQLAFLYVWNRSGTGPPEWLVEAIKQRPWHIDTLHLWFLYDLIYFYLGAALLDWAVRRLPAGLVEVFRKGSRGLSARPIVRPLALSLPTTMVLLATPRGIIETTTSLTPDPLPLLANGLFFGFGWLTYRNRDLLPSWTRWARTQVLMGSLVLFPINTIAIGVQLGLGSAPQPIARVVSAVSSGLLAWVMIFGVGGVFLRHLDFPSRPLRYLTDASYWVYLAHLPVVIVLTGVFAPLAWPALVKCSLVVMVSMAVLLGSYHVLVRSTILGEWLSGVRHPIVRRKPEHRPAADPVAS